jgi:hypothetical protein
MFIAEYPDGFGELYDLQQDPWEMQNLYFDPQHRQTVEQLITTLMDWLLTTRRVRTTQVRTRINQLPYVTRYGGSILPDGKVATRPVLHGPTINYL